MPRKKRDEILDDIEKVEDEPEVDIKKVAEEVAGKPETVADGSTIIEVKSLAGKAGEMRKKLASQPKVPVMIPLDPGEPFGSTLPVVLNGYQLNIKKGVYVHVPKQVAEVVMRSLNQTAEAINNYYLMNERGVSQAMRDKGL